jgi:hypothetical protein
MVPLFKRPDGELVQGEDFLRTLLPYLIKSRAEGQMLTETEYDLTRTLPWLEAFNAAGPPGRATLFHLLLWSITQAYHAFPRVNRFVSGRRIYQHRAVTVTFASKVRFAADAAMVMNKVEFPKDEPFVEMVCRLRSIIEGSRDGKHHDEAWDVKLASILPDPALRLGLWLMHRADQLNLLPPGVIAGNPMFTSLCITNLGSVGLDRTFHHLNEMGTASVFASIGVQKKVVAVDDGGQPCVREGLRVRWSVDERVMDGITAFTALEIARKIFEDPTAHLGGPEQAARGESVGSGDL